MGRSHARDAGKAGADPQIIVGLFVISLLISMLVVINIAVRVNEAIHGTPAEVSPNPFMVLGQVLGGSIPWTTTMTLAAASVFLLLLAAVAFVFFLRPWGKDAKHKTSVDAAQRYLGDKKDIASLSRAAAVAKARKWISDPELAEEYPGLRLGRVPGKGKRGLYSTWEDLYLIVFGPRMGKTTSQVIPAIVDAPGPVLTTSNKSDIIYETMGVRGPIGEIYAFDPQRIAANFKQDPWFFDPLDMVRKTPATMDAAAVELADIFKCAAQGENGGGDAFFVDGGRDLLARMFLAAAVANKPITEVYTWVNNDKDLTPVRLLEADGNWQLQKAALEGQYQITERTRSGIFSQAAQMATPLGRKEASRWITPTDGARKFSPEDFVRSEADTLYVLSKEGADNAAALTTALTAAVMKAAEEYGESCGGRLPVPLVAPLDEAANVVRWPQLPKLYSHYGSRSIILMTILQSYAQGVSVWGEEGMEALWSASAILMYGGGVRDEKMLNKLESLLGDYEEWTTSVSRGGDGNRSVSKQKREKKILTVAELASLGGGKAVVFASQRRPIIAQLEPFWERDYWPEEIRAALPGKN